MLNQPSSGICIIVPCFNEQDSIANVIEEISSIDSSLQIIVINDGSEDLTSEVARNTGKVTTIDMPVNTGVGGAVQTGFMYAASLQAAYAIKIDGDGQHNPSCIKELLLPLVENKADIVIGSRFKVENSGYKSSFFRRMGIKILQIICSWLSGQQITDPTSGFRAYNSSAIKFMAQHYPSFDYPEPEEIIIAAKNGLRLIEMPTRMRERKTGTSTISSAISIYYMLKVTLAMLFIALRRPISLQSRNRDV